MSACLCCIGSEGVPESCILAGSACSGTPFWEPKYRPFLEPIASLDSDFGGGGMGWGWGLGWAGLAHFRVWSYIVVKI